MTDGAAPPIAPHRTHSNLQLRLMTAAVGLPVLLTVVWVGGWPFAVTLGAVSLLASAEFAHGWLIPSLPVRRVVAFAQMFAVTGLMVAGSHANPRFFWLGVVLAVLFAFLGYVPTNLFGPRKPFRVFMGCVLYLGVPLTAMVLLRDMEQGRDWVLLGALSTFAVDTGAYAVGMLFGRHKMAPKISPKKTWEGAVGGYVSGFAAVLALNAVLGTNLTAAEMLPFAVIAPVLAEVGDLAESWMKRRMGVKDASGLLPGHGGFLDRLDSLLFVLPALYVFLQVRGS